MGTYYYSLRTKSRRIVIAGEKHDVHPVEFAYKHEPKHFKLTEARMEAAWNHRDTPAYIVWGGFEEGNEVYRRWPDGVVVASEYIVDSLEFVGVLISNGRGGFTVQEWTTIEVGEPITPLAASNHVHIKALADMGIEQGTFRVYNRKGRGMEPIMTVACFLHPKDAVLGRVILA